MPNIPIRKLGSVGIIKDPGSASLPPSVFTDGANVRFDADLVQRAPLYRVVADSLTGTVPVYCFGLYAESGFDRILYGNNDGRLFVVNSGTQSEVTETGHTNTVGGSPWTGCILSQCVYANRPEQVPVYLGPEAPTFAVLPGWDSTWRCESLRSFKDFLVALNVTKGAASFPTMFKWSDGALNGVPPASWDETDTTKLAGENVLDQLKTPIVDGGPLGDFFIVYSRDETWRVDFNSGSDLLFDFRRLPFDNAGIINTNCWVEIDGMHFVFGEDDIYKHDGIGKHSIIDQRNRDTFFHELNMQERSRFFIAHDKYRHEIIFCGVSLNAKAVVQSPSVGCNYGAVYNYVNDTWSFIDLPNVTFSSTANVNTVLTYDTCPADLTYDNVGGTYADQSDSFSRFALLTSVADTANGLSVSKLVALDDADRGKLALRYDSEALYEAWVERTGFELDTEGAPLRAYKHARAMMPLIKVFVPGVSIGVSMGSHEVLSSNVAWDNPTAFNPAVHYKVDTRKGGRYLAYRFSQSDAHDFGISGFDLDVVVTGKR